MTKTYYVLIYLSIWRLKVSLSSIQIHYIQIFCNFPNFLLPLSLALQNNLKFVLWAFTSLRWRVLKECRRFSTASWAQSYCKCIVNICVKCTWQSVKSEISIVKSNEAKMEARGTPSVINKNSEWIVQWLQWETYEDVKVLQEAFSARDILKVDPI